MRVLLVNKFHYPKGGAEKAYFDTARILTDAGHEVAFFSMQHPENLETPWSRFFVSRSEYVEGEEKLSLWEKICLAFNIIWNREAQKKLEALIQEFKPDVAHLHNIYHQLSPSIIWTLKKHGVPMLMTLHDYKLISPNYSLYCQGEIWEHASGWRCLLDRCVKDSALKSSVCVIEQWVHAILGSYRQINRFIAPSQFLIDEMHKLGFRGEIARLPQPLLPFPEHPIPAPGSSLFFVGRLSEEKGVDFLLKAMAELPEETLDIVGSGPSEALLKAQAEALHLTNVRFLGPLFGEAMLVKMRESKAVVLPSRWYENMPYVLVEALASGKVVLASRLGGMVERIDEGVNGFLFDTEAPHELLQKVRGLAEVNLADLGKNARESVKDLQPEAYKMALLSHYQAIISPPED